MKSRFLFLGASAVLALAACDSATAPDPTLSADVNEIAADMDALSLVSLTDAGATAFGPVFSISSEGGITSAPLATVTPVNRTINVTRPCPAGGTVTLAGTATGTSDPAAHNLTITSNVTRTEAACAFSTQHGVVTVNGSPNVALTSSVNIVAGKPVGVQTQTHKGAFTWTRGTNSGTCAVDVTSSFDPAAGTITVTGSMCGRTVNTSRTAPKLP